MGYALGGVCLMAGGPTWGPPIITARMCEERHLSAGEAGPRFQALFCLRGVFVACMDCLCTVGRILAWCGARRSRLTLW